MKMKDLPIFGRSFDMILRSLRAVYFMPNLMEKQKKLLAIPGVIH